MSHSARPLVITGATGTLGQALARACEHRGLSYVLTCRNELPIHDPDRTASALAEIQPWAVINAAGFVRVDDAEKEADACMAANAKGVEHLAEACSAAGIPLVGFSSDLVFDGAKAGHYVEADTPAPLNVYGRSKAAAEAALLAAEGGLAVRTAAFFSSRDRYNFAHHCLETLKRGERFAAAADYEVSPTYTPDLVEATLDLLIDGEAGVWHLASEGDGISWAEFGRMLARAAGLDDRLVADAEGASLGWVAPRPRRSALASARGSHMAALKDAVARFAEEARQTRETPATEGHRRGEIVREPKSFRVEAAV